MRFARAKQRSIAIRFGALCSDCGTERVTGNPEVTSRGDPNKRRRPSSTIRWPGVRLAAMVSKRYPDYQQIPANRLVM